MVSWTGGGYIAGVLSTAAVLFPDICEGSWQHCAMSDLAAEAYRVADVVYGAREAVEWSDSFVFPQSAVDQDVADFGASQWDFDDLVRRRLRSLRDNRLSRERIDRVIGADNPERDKLLHLASSGMPLLRDPNFVTIGSLIKSKDLLAKTLTAIVSSSDLA